ncbi:MAG: hypothetical protein JNN01_21335 [Opitutaceae bacterium]|nr:hypothetical protein [Opitutaceae bacterium]
MKTNLVRSVAVGVIVLLLASGIGLGRLFWPLLGLRAQAMLGAAGQLIAWATLGVMAVLVEKQRGLQPPQSTRSRDTPHPPVQPNLQS